MSSAVHNLLTMKAGSFNVILDVDIPSGHTFGESGLNLVSAGVVYSRFERIPRNVFEFKFRCVIFDRKRNSAYSIVIYDLAAAIGFGSLGRYKMATVGFVRSSRFCTVAIRVYTTVTHFDKYFQS